MNKNKKILLFGTLLCLFSSMSFNTTKTLLKANSNVLYTLPNNVSYVEGIVSLKVGESMTISLEDNVYAVSEDTNVARINSSGKITAIGFGKTTIEFIGESKTEYLQIIVKNNYDSSVITQANSFPSYQGENNFYIYKSENGDIENDIANGISSFVYHDTTNDAGWWDNKTFVGHDHFGGRGSGALSYKVVYPGNYTIDYSAWLLSSLRTNPEYMNWNIDGFTTGLAKKTSGGEITVLVSNIGTKESVVNDKTRYQMGTVTLDLNSNDEVMLFYCSNGNGDCDEVYTEFAITLNEITGEPLYIMPSKYEVFETYPMLYIGQSMQLELRDGATISSSNQDVIEVDSTGKLLGKALGASRISIQEGNDADSFVVFCDKNYSSNTISQKNNFPKKQGDNNLYIYSSLEKNYALALDSLELMDNSYSSSSDWKNNNVYANSERVFCNGTGAISFKAPSDGNFSIDYKAYLRNDMRTNSLYLTEWNTDGFTSGLAKKDLDGNVTVLDVTVGTKESVVEIDTMLHSDSITLDLVANEEIMFFFSSNNTEDCDEIMSTFNVTPNNLKIYDGSLSFNESLPKIWDVGILYVGETTNVITNYTGNLNYSSSNENVATIDENGNITAIGIGTTVIKAYDSFSSNQLVLNVKTKDEGQVVFDQTKDLPSLQGDKNAYIYYGNNGNIEDDLVNGLSKAILMENNYYNSMEKSWWNNIVFANSVRVFTNGVGMISYKVPEEGNYRLDYYAYLMAEHFNNPLYPTYESVDGFSVGLGKKSIDGTITLIDSNINTQKGVIADETRFMTNECVCNAQAGEELFFFFISNGTGDCDEIINNFKVQRVYLENEERPVEINLQNNDDFICLDIGEEYNVNVDLKYYDNQEIIWTSSNTDVATVSNSGKIKAINSGLSEIIITIGKSVAKITVCVNYNVSYIQGNGNDLEIELDDSFDDDYIFRITMDNNKISNKSYGIIENKIIFKAEYLDSLDIGSKKIMFRTEDGIYIINLDVRQNNNLQSRKKLNTQNEIINKDGTVIGILALIIVGCALVVARKERSVN